jgi:hypothetical protein
VGNSDHNNAGDWTFASPSIGRRNTGLTTPFVPAAISVPIAPTVTTAFVHGVWTGQVTVLAAANGMHLRADDGHGHVVASNLFNAAPAPAPAPAPLPEVMAPMSAQPAPLAALSATAPSPPAAYDAALASSALSDPILPLPWLYEFEQINSSGGASKKDKSLTGALDAFFART